MNMQIIVYKGCEIRLQDEDLYLYLVYKEYQFAHVTQGDRIIKAYGTDVIEQAKEMLDKTTFDDWFRNSCTAAHCPPNRAKVASYLFAD